MSGFRQYDFDMDFKRATDEKLHNQNVAIDKIPQLISESVKSQDSQLDTDFKNFVEGSVTKWDVYISIGGTVVQTLVLI